MLVWKRSRVLAEDYDARCGLRARKMSWARCVEALMAVFLSVGLQAGVWAQTVPTDLLDLSIEELFDANVVSEADRTERQNRWHLSYTYAISEYDEYYWVPTAFPMMRCCSHPASTRGLKIITPWCPLKSRRKCTRFGLPMT